MHHTSFDYLTLHFLLFSMKRIEICNSSVAALGHIPNLRLLIYYTHLNC